MHGEEFNTGVLRLNCCTQSISARNRLAITSAETPNFGSVRVAMTFSESGRPDRSNFRRAWRSGLLPHGWRSDVSAPEDGTPMVAALPLRVSIG